MSAALSSSPVNTDALVWGYCVHCRTRRQMHGAIQVCNRRGGRDLKGHCAVCGKAMHRLGGWEAVAAAAQKAANAPLGAVHSPAAEAPPSP